MLDGSLFLVNSVAIDTEPVPPLLPICLYSTPLYSYLYFLQRNFLQKLRASGLFEEMCPIGESISGNRQGQGANMLTTFEFFHQMYIQRSLWCSKFSVRRLNSCGRVVPFSSSAGLVQMNDQGLHLRSDCINQSDKQLKVKHDWAC
jgi:hypothetical protein